MQIIFSLSDGNSLTHAEFQLPHHLPKHTYIVITTEPMQAWTALTRSATLALVKPHVQQDLNQQH